jgi:transcriptional regulator with GAF, ATPase, and Fis domain
MYLENSAIIFKQRGPDAENLQPAESPAVLDNKLEALKSLASTILSEVSSMKRSQQKPPEEINLTEEVQEFEIGLIRCALIRTGGNQREAARVLKIKPTTLHEKIKRYGIMATGAAPRQPSAQA